MSELLDTWFSLWIGRFITVWIITAGLAITIRFLIPKIVSVFLHTFDGHPMRLMAFMIITIMAAVTATLSKD